MTIIDGGGDQRLFAPFASLMQPGSRSESADRVERGVSVSGYPGWERWDRGTHNGELGIAVNRRVLVQIEGRSVETIDTLHMLLDATDLARLASLP